MIFLIMHSTELQSLCCLWQPIVSWLLYNHESGQVKEAIGHTTAHWVSSLLSLKFYEIGIHVDALFDFWSHTNVGITE